MTVDVSGVEQRPVELASLDLLPEAVVVLDQAGLVAAANDRASALLGIDAAAIGRPLKDVLDVVDDTGGRPRLPPPVPRVGDRMAERLLTLKLADGNLRPISVSGRLVDGAWTLTARTAGRRNALDRVHGDVVATVSHEIRSPLTTVKGFVRTLLMRWDRFTDDQKLAMLATVDADADRISRLLMDLLEVSRIDAGRVTLRRSRVDVEALLTSVVDRVSHREDVTERDLRVIVAPGLPELWADRDRLEQVLLNLVDNALRYAPSGAITLSTDVAPESAASDPGGAVCITVADEGPGVPDDLRHSIFHKFARGRENQLSGTGLGLYISRGLVQAHQGRIELVDTPKGATFRIQLPLPPDEGTGT